jgi:hypothetical protein
MRTILPLILLTALIVSIWPTGPLDFGSRSPWDGLVILIDGVERFVDEDGDRGDGDAADSSPLDPQSRLLLIASLPAVDDLGRDCSLIVGTAFADHSDPLALLLQGETDAIRLQKIKMVAPPAEMYRSIEGIISGFSVPGDLDVDYFPGGLLHGDQVTPAASSRQGPPPPSILLADSRGSTTFEAHCDEQKQQRWRGDRKDFRELWGRAHDTDPDRLEPFIHGRLTLPELPDPARDAVAPGQRR